MFSPKKKYIIPVLIAVLPLLAMMPWKVKKLQRYFPLTKGNMWQYNLYSPTDHELTVHDSIFCTGDTAINGKRYVTIAGEKAERIFPAGYWRFDKTVLYRHHTLRNRDVLFADFSKQKGEQITYTSDTLVYTARVLSTDTTYTVPFPWKVNTSDEPLTPASFTNAYCVEWTEKNNSDKVILFFKQGIGLVGVKMAGGEELYLQSWVIAKR